MTWLKTGICAGTSSKWNVMLTDWAQAALLGQVILCAFSFAGRHPKLALIGSLRAAWEVDEWSFLAVTEPKTSKGEGFVDGLLLQFAWVSSLVTAK